MLSRSVRTDVLAVIMGAFPALITDPQLSLELFFHLETGQHCPPAVQTVSAALQGIIHIQHESRLTAFHPEDVKLNNSAALRQRRNCLTLLTSAFLL